MVYNIYSSFKGTLLNVFLQDRAVGQLATGSLRVEVAGSSPALATNNAESITAIV